MISSNKLGVKRVGSNEEGEWHVDHDLLPQQTFKAPVATHVRIPT